MRLSLLSLFALTFFIGCSDPTLDSKVQLLDIQEKETIELRATSQSSSVYFLSINLKGYVDGKASVSLIANKTIIKQELLSGDINLKWRTDWYSDSATVVYEPSGQVSGELSLHYSFQTMD